MDKYLLGDRYSTWDAGQEAYYPALDISPYPDDPAGTTYVQDVWATVDGWYGNTGSTVSFENNSLKVVFDGIGANGASCGRVITGLATGKTLKFKVRSLNKILRVHYYNAGSESSAFLESKISDKEWLVSITLGTITNESLTLYVNIGETAANTVWFDFIYVGTGKYLDGSLVDTSGNWNHATIYGGVPDGEGGIIRDGINDYERTVDAIAFPDVFHYHESLEIPNHATQIQVIFTAGISTAGYLALYRGINSRRLYLAYYDGVVKTLSFANFFEIDDTKVELDLGVDWLLGTYIIYKNGTTLASGSIPGAIKPSSVWYFGNTYTLDSTQFCGGRVSNRRWYNRALTAQQVSDLASNTVYTYGRLYNEEMLNNHEFLAAWSNAYQFDYLSGTTVFVTPVLSANIPTGTEVQICAGESLEDCTILESGVKGQVLFTSPTSGPKNLYVKLNLFSSQYGITPVVSELTLLVEQSTSLYTIATQILSDALTPSNGKWEIDTELQKYPIPYAWFNTIKHREAIGKVAEAAGGVAFQDRYGFVRVQAGNYLSRLNGTSNFNIGEDRILDAESPVSEVKNRIIIKTRPYVVDTLATVWELTGDKTIGDGESKTYKATFSDYDAVVDCSSSISSVPAGATITSETFYSFGADITVLGSAEGQVLTLSVSGTPLVIKGARIIEESDGDSIRRNGDRSLTIEDNSMIQSAEVAETIAEDILATIAEEKRDIVINWRGDPTLELGDKGTVTGYNVAIVEQEFNFNGALSVMSRMRKV